MIHFFLLFFTFSTILIASPQIIIQKRQIDLGTYYSNIEKKVIFTIQNNGPDDLKILKVRKTCNCTKTHIEKTEIKPNETTNLHVSLLPNSINGKFSKRVIIQSNDPKQSFIPLTLTGKTVSPVRVSPSRDMYLGTLPQNSSWSKNFLIITAKNKIALTAPQNEKHKDLTVDLKKINSTTYRLQLSGKVTHKNIKHLVKLHYNIPNALPLQITITANTLLKAQTMCPYINLPINISYYFDYKDIRIFTCCVPCLEKVKKDPLDAIAHLKTKGQKPIKIASVSKH